MDYIKIDNKAYDVIVTDVEENFNILYSENTGRTISQGAKMFLDPLGTFLGHKITFRRRAGYEQEYDELFDLAGKPTSEGVLVEFPHNQTTITYQAYVSQGARKLQRIDENTGKMYWGEFSLNFTPMEAQVLS